MLLRDCHHAGMAEAGANYDGKLSTRLRRALPLLSQVP